MHETNTQRLTLRMVTQDDAYFIHELYSGDDFHQFIGDKGISSPQIALDYIQNNILEMHQSKGVGLLVVVLRETNRAIGVCGLIKRDTLDAYDVGYGFLPEMYGKGYAYEASQAIIGQAKHNPDIDHLVAITTSDNIRSINLLEKLGFGFERVEEKLSETTTLNLYALPLGNT